MSNWEDISKPKCYREGMDSRDCVGKIKHKGDFRDKCRSCEFRFYHKYMMAHDESYKIITRLLEKTSK